MPLCPPLKDPSEGVLTVEPSRRGARRVSYPWSWIQEDPTIVSCRAELRELAGGHREATLELSPTFEAVPTKSRASRLASAVVTFVVVRPKPKVVKVAVPTGDSVFLNPRWPPQAEVVGSECRDDVEQVRPRVPEAQPRLQPPRDRWATLPHWRTPYHSSELSPAGSEGWVRGHLEHRDPLGQGWGDRGQVVADFEDVQDPIEEGLGCLLADLFPQVVPRLWISLRHG